jgi:hypothetical protein
MTPTRVEPVTGRTRSRAARAAAAAVVVALGAASLASACDSSSSSSTTAAAVTAAVVKPPTAVLQGCTYAPDNKVPPGQPQGMRPPFAPFSPDPAAQSALRHIEAHGGTGLVYGFQFPSGTKLYAGPDASSGAVGTIPTGRSVYFFDPVIWTTSSGQHWLVSFLACGGASPYWVDVNQIQQADVTVYNGIVQQITTLLASQDYVTTGHASSLPVVIGTDHLFAWKNPKVPFAPGRGEYVGFGV